MNRIGRCDFCDLYTVPFRFAARTDIPRLLDHIVWLQKQYDEANKKIDTPLSAVIGVNYYRQNSDL